MFKKITAVLAAVLLGVGISVVSVAAPASAHTPSHGVSCNSLWVSGVFYETRNDNPKPNNVTVVIDGQTVLDEDFGATLPKQTVNFDGATSHTWSIVIDAVGGTNNTQYDWSKSGVTTPCSYPDRDLELVCGTATAILDAALANGNHINMEVLINGVTKTLNAYVDQNVPGGWSGPGWNQAGLRITDINGVQTTVPLTEQQILSGKFTFKYGDYLGGATSYSVVWVQMETVHFNDTKLVTGYLNCGFKDVTVEAKPSVTQPTCLEDGKLVIPTQTGVVFTGGKNGDGPGTYNLVAVAAPGYKLTAPYSVQLVVKPADPTKCEMDPKATVDLGVCTATTDGKSQKSTTFWFDNSESEAPVTFTIPSLNISQLVAAGAGPVSVAGPKVDHNVGGSWDVYANGVLLKTLTVAKFADCLTLVVPGDPSSTDQKCVAGELSDGSITVVPNVGKIVYVITGGNIAEPGITVPDNNPVTSLPAGDYVVTAHGINGFKVGPENTWSYDISVGEPEDCEKVTIPVSSLNQMTCVAGSPIGSYTLPTGSEWVEWYVNDVLTTTPTDVTVASTVKVEAKITAAGLAAGIAFTDGTTSKVYNHEFVAPEDCEKVTVPVSSLNQMTCVAGAPIGSYTLPTGSEWVEWYVNDVLATTPTDVTVAGTVKVEAKITAAGVAAGIVFTDGTISKVYQHEFVAPEDCEKVTIPVSSKSDMACVSNSPTGTYTLPETKWVEWYVDGVLTTTPKAVHVAGDVVVEAKITAAGIAAGIVFTDGTTVNTVTHTFVLPTEDCDPPTLALLNPTASQNNGSCTADPTYTLSNTTSPNGGVQWWIGDPQVKTSPGTHKASWGSTVVVEAKVVNPNLDGLETSPAVWTFKFPAKPAACGDLITLALTGGSTGGFVPWIIGALLLLGGAGIYFARRQVTTEK